MVEFPTKERSKLSTDKLYQCKWTNCRKGYAHMTWDKEGIDTYNDLVTNISGLREDKLTGYKLEARVKADFEELKKTRGRGKKKTNNRISASNGWCIARKACCIEE